MGMVLQSSNNLRMIAYKVSQKLAINQHSLAQELKSKRMRKSKPQEATYHSKRKQWYAQTRVELKSTCSIRKKRKSHPRNRQKATGIRKGNWRRSRRSIRKLHQKSTFQLHSALKNTNPSRIGHRRPWLGMMSLSLVIAPKRQILTTWMRVKSYKVSNSRRKRSK